MGLGDDVPSGGETAASRQGALGSVPDKANALLVGRLYNNLNLRTVGRYVSLDARRYV
jgi:hypothetical protein